MNVCDGIVLMANKTGKQFFAYSKASWLNEPWIKIIVLIIMFIAGYILFNYTHIGKSMISMGGSMKVAKISGINTTKMIFIAYIICSVAIGVASLFAVVRGGIADTSIGSSVNLNVMIAVVLGGFPLFGGGKARYQGPLIGALMVTILTNGLSMMGYASALGYAIKGILFLVVVGITYDRSKGKLID
jgi:ribose transport system permease protein